MYKTKLRAVGKSTGLIIPRELLERMNLKEGDMLTIQETRAGYMIAPYDPEFEQAMELTNKVMRQYRNTLKKLAE